MTGKQRLQMLMLCKVNRALVRLNTILEGNGLADSETKRTVKDANRVLRIVGYRIIRAERTYKRPVNTDILLKRILALEAENGRLREALKEIAELANNEYWKRIPDPSCPKFMTIKRYAEKALKGAGE